MRLTTADQWKLRERYMEKFSLEVASQLGWYVYRLIDPRTGHTFYVGKGQGNRVFDHANGELNEVDIEESGSGEMPLKRETIRAIRNQNLSVIHLIHRHGLATSDAAYEVEAALIDAYPGLSNIAGGHHNELRGCRSVKEINRAYAADPLVAHEPLILIFVGRLITERDDIYNAVRGIWKMSLVKAGQRQLVLAYDGVTVTGAFRPTKWMVASQANFPFLKKDALDRIGFEGHPAEVESEYLGKRVPPRPRGAANPFRYLPE